ncbi:MAG TPA: hypothetical protein VMT85_23545, partial [Thermoanaerobaculia bacterium]|nr:hypothetical protein [Thermoanaerobaculia bacterium]
MRGFRIGWIGLVMATLVVTGAWATTPDRTPAIHSNLLPFQLDLEPLVEHESVTLSVSGPGNFFYRESFAAGNPIGFAIQQDGEVLADGLYTWEAVVNPRLSSDVIRSLAQARAAGDDAVADRLRESGQLPAERQMESGSFRVVQGSILTDTGPEREPGTGAPSGGMTRVPSADVRVSSPDQVIPDDLIVQRSLCVGFDCVNNEDFGFDTIRLKENNLRIKFEDTSAGTFPSRDWQLTANDSTNGGANRFSIDDIDGGRTPFTIEAAAPTNSLYVESDGDIGLGTANPVVRLHLVDGDTPALRLQQDGSSGFQQQTWDVAGNETNFFVRDASNGSTLPFRIRPGAPSSA